MDVQRGRLRTREGSFGRDDQGATGGRRSGGWHHRTSASTVGQQRPVVEWIYRQEGRCLRPFLTFRL
jgi:hypothetical protein